MRRKGFTLIELLVVIAINAILAAILFPVFAKAREKARQASCLSNIKQMALGMLMYKDDYDQTWPISNFPAMQSGVYQMPGSIQYKSNDGTSQYFMWFTVIYPYQKSKNIVNCPSQGIESNDPGCMAESIDGPLTIDKWCYTVGTPFVSDDDSLYDTHSQGKLGKKTDDCGFCYSPFVSQQWIMQTPKIATTGANGAFANGYLPTTDAMILLPDTKFIGWDTDTPYSWQINWTSPSERNFGVACRHSGGANFAFADGHAKWLKAESLGIPPTDQFPVDGNGYHSLHHKLDWNVPALAKVTRSFVPEADAL
jgi:prepilin-type N-terminal cleavage/methylation domain-containing protein/prepilin-type processing-associated H-X9-DG protein